MGGHSYIETLEEEDIKRFSKNHNNLDFNFTNKVNKKYFNYDDINLVPKKGIVNSRSECDTSVEMGGFKFKLPVYPANMESVINIKLCEELATNGYFYTMHRFGVDQIEFIKYMKSKNLFTSISIGVNSDSYDLIDELVENNLIPDYINLDVAHAHSIKGQNMLYHLKLNKKITSFIIAGNICTVEAAHDLIKWGADAIKIGIGNGSVCSTFYETGFGSNGIQSSIIKIISDSVKHFNKKVYIIADGGIKHRADISKAIVMGADMVMSGSLFACLMDSPAEDRHTGAYKGYHGSASSKQSGKMNRIEGIEELIPIKENTYLEELKSIEEALESAISYAGAKELSALKTVEYIIK